MADSGGWGDIGGTTLGDVSGLGTLAGISGTNVGGIDPAGNSVGGPGGESGGGIGGMVSKVASFVVGLLTSVVTGNIAVGTVVGRLVNMGLNSEFAKNLVDNVKAGNITPTDAGQLSGKQYVKQAFGFDGVPTDSQLVDALTKMYGTGNELSDEGTRQTITDIVRGERGRDSDNITSQIYDAVDFLRNEDLYTETDWTELQQENDNVSGEQVDETTATVPTDAHPNIGDEGTPQGQATEQAQQSMWETEPSEIEQKISSYQLEVARNLSSKIADPKVMESIYALLPATRMSMADRTKFTEEYTDIKKRVATASLEQSNKAFGMNLDDMVSRGVVSQEFADKQKMKNEAAVNTVISMYNKKLDAARIGMARDQYFKSSQAGLQTAGYIADIDNRNQQIYNGVISQALANLTSKETAGINYSGSLANAALHNQQLINQGNLNFSHDMANLAAHNINSVFDSNYNGDPNDNLVFG